MDPQSQSFTPHNHSSESWRIQADVARMQQVQAEHADRISRLERKHDEDARMKSVWGTQSPFPSVLSGTPQQAPLQHPPGDQFRNFDDEATTLLSSVHFDAEDEPRRGVGATSRANSVRFDESANQNHFSHSSRPSMDALSRTSSGLGGLQMTERSSSHKSEGRASSAHSIRSLASGRANSLNLDSSAFGLGDLNRSLNEAPRIAPGLMLLGPAPAIIRCWMNTNFKHDALLYAAVCTGSFKSYLDIRLIKKLGFEGVIKTNADGIHVVDLPMFFPEAVPHPPSSRPSSPAPSLPSILVEFRVIATSGQDEDGKAIQIFLGSDVLRAHNADILFSSNSMTIYDNDRNKLSIPLTRPEDEAAFNSLMVTGTAPQALVQQVEKPDSADAPAIQRPYLNGLGRGSSAASLSSTTSPPPGKHGPQSATSAEAVSVGSIEAGALSTDRDFRPASRTSTISRPSLSLLNTKNEYEEIQPPADAPLQSTSARTASSSNVWGTWRRDPSASATTQTSGLDWANLSRNRDTSYQRKETGIKVLKPKMANRTFSTPATTPLTGTSSPADGKSRFFDEGRRRSVGEDAPGKPAAPSKENAAVPSSATAAPKTKANPIGGASAFSWLNPGASK